MATETFFKKIIIDEDAADILISEMEKPRAKPENELSIFESLKRGDDLFQQRESRLRRLSEQSKSQNL